MVDPTFETLGQKVGSLVDQKSASYGDSIRSAAKMLQLLFPDGIRSDQYCDVVILSRMWDKFSRLAHDPEAFGENPYEDIVGYGLRGMDLRKHVGPR